MALLWWLWRSETIDDVDDSSHREPRAISRAKQCRSFAADLASALESRVAFVPGDAGRLDGWKILIVTLFITCVLGDCL